MILLQIDITLVWEDPIKINWPSTHKGFVFGRAPFHHNGCDLTKMSRSLSQAN